MYCLALYQLPIIHCSVTNELRTQWPKTTYIYYLSVSVDQESGHSLAKSSTSRSLTGCDQGVGWAFSISRINRERICFKAHVVVGRIQFLWVVGLRASVPCWLLAEDHPHFLAVWAFPTGQLLHRSMQAGKAIESMLGRWNVL